MELVVRLDTQGERTITKLRKENCNLTQLINLLLREYADNINCYNNIVNSTTNK